MDTYGRFLFEFLEQFFAGFKDILGGFFNGIVKIFNIPQYKVLIERYKTDFSITEWTLVALAIIAVASVIAIIGILIFLFMKRHM